MKSLNAQMNFLLLVNLYQSLKTSSSHSKSMCHSPESCLRPFQTDIMKLQTLKLREKCPYSQLFWSAFSRIRTEYEVSLRIQSKCGKMRTRITPNTDTFYAVLWSYLLRPGPISTLKSYYYVQQHGMILLMTTNRQRYIILFDFRLNRHHLFISNKLLFLVRLSAGSKSIILQSIARKL